MNPQICTYEISFYKTEGWPIPSSSIDTHRRKLDLVPIKHQYIGEMGYETIMEHLHEWFFRTNLMGRQQMLKRVIEIFTLEISHL